MTYLEEKLRDLDLESVKAYKKKFRYTNASLGVMLGVTEDTIQRYISGTNEGGLMFKNALMGLQMRPILTNVLGREQVELEIIRHNNILRMFVNDRKSPMVEILDLDSNDTRTADELANVKKEIKPRGPTRRELADSRQQEKDALINEAVEAECGGIAEDPSMDNDVNDLGTALTPEQENERRRMVEDIKTRRRASKRIKMSDLKEPDKPNEKASEVETVETATGTYAVHPDLRKPITEELFDSEGTLFDPELHQVTKNGHPLKNFGKTWRKIKK